MFFNRPPLAATAICSSSLKTVVITSGTSLVNTAFSYCRNLESVTLPDSITSIGYHALTVILSRLEHPENALSPILVTLSGIVILLRLAHLENVREFIIVKPLGIFMLVKLLQSPNASMPIYLTLSGIVKVVSTLQSQNALAAIPIILSLIAALLIETASKMLILGCKNSTIPNDGSVVSIGSYAFRGCSELTNLTERT